MRPADPSGSTDRQGGSLVADDVGNVVWARPRNSVSVTVINVYDGNLPRRSPPPPNVYPALPNRCAAVAGRILESIAARPSYANSNWRFAPTTRIGRRPGRPWLPAIVVVVDRILIVPSTRARSPRSGWWPLDLAARVGCKGSDACWRARRQRSSSLRKFNRDSTLSAGISRCN